jgi:hypothetical protein
MFNYAADILSHFTEKLTSPKVYSVDSFRIDIEDFVYIVETKIGDFILYETDYMFDTDEAINVLKTIASENSFTYGNLLTPDHFGEDARILRMDGNSRIYLAAGINANEHHFHVDPVGYGGKDGK